MDNGKLCENISTVFIKPHPPSSTLLLLLSFSHFWLVIPRVNSHVIPQKLFVKYKSNNNSCVLFLPFYFELIIGKYFVLEFRWTPGDRIKMLFFFNMKKDSRSAIVSFVCFGYGILIYFRVISYPELHPPTKLRGGRSLMSLSENFERG